MNEDLNTSNKSIFTISNILIMIALIIVLVLIIWNQTFTNEIFLEPTQELHKTATPATIAAEETLIPSEFYSEVTDTTGVIRGATLLLFIILSTSIWSILFRKK